MLTRIGSLIFAAPGIFLLVLYGVELAAITECQQQGLFYNALTSQCQADAPAFSTFYMRHSLMVNLNLLLATLGAVIMTLGMLKRKA